MRSESGERLSSSELPEDRFDRLPHADRVGAHRIAGRVRHVWRYLLIGALATAVLTTAGIIGLKLSEAHGPDSTDDTAVGPTEDAVIPVLDPTATIVVLNGTPTPSLASGVDQVITKNEWGQIAFSDNADVNNVTISAVFYSDIADLPAAEGLAEKLGGVSTYQSDSYISFGVRLVVLIGADYAGPGFDEAEQISAQLGGDADISTG